jgi:hypothetical protein
MKTVVKQSVSDEAWELGYDGRILLDLIKEHNFPLHRALQQKGTLLEMISEAEQQYSREIQQMMQGGMQEIEAKEIAWKELTAQFGVKR